MKAHFEAPSIEVQKRVVILNDAATIGKVQGHPNLIRMKEVYSRGKIAAVSDGQSQVKEVFAIMVLETIRGGELYYHIRKCAGFSLGVSNLFFQQLSGALWHMHNSGYCHRDLKPWNIMMSSDLSSVKIIDFGYATPLDPAELAKSSRFLRGKLSCTANYMAPELY